MYGETALRQVTGGAARIASETTITLQGSPSHARLQIRLLEVPRRCLPGTPPLPRPAYDFEFLQAWLTSRVLQIGLIRAQRGRDKAPSRSEVDCPFLGFGPEFWSVSFPGQGQVPSTRFSHNWGFRTTEDAEIRQGSFTDLETGH